MTRIDAGGTDPNGYRIDDLLVDVGARLVTRDGEDLGIAGLSFDLLITLVRAAPNLVSTDTLMEEVWSGVIVGPETIKQRVKLLRQGLGDDAAKPRYIAGLRGHGYRMVADVVPLAHATLNAGTPCEPPRPAAVSPMRRWRLVVAVLALLIGATILWTLWPMSTAGTRTVRLSHPVIESPGSIAVMPFANLTGEPGKDYLADGMADELINALSAVPGLKVPARTSSFAYKGRETDVRQIAHDLGVATILEGSVRSAGDRIRISARLVDANSGFQIWTQTYDRQFADLLNLEDDLAAEILQAMRGHLNVGLPMAAGRSPPTRDVQAYQLYLQAHAVAQGDESTQHEAARLVDQALARDPNFARAMAYRAFLQTSLAHHGSASEDALAGAEHDARRALTLSPGLAEAYAALGSILGIRGNWAAADMTFRAGVAANPTDPWLRDDYAVAILMQTGRLRQALTQTRESYRLSPASGFSIGMLSLVNALMGADADAIRFGDLSGKLGGHGPSDWGIVFVDTRAVAGSGRHEEAAARAAQMLAPPLRRGGEPAIRAFYAALADPTKRPAALKALQDFVPALLAAHDAAQTRIFGVEMFTMLDALDSAYELAIRSLYDGLRTGRIADSLYPANFWLPEMRPFRKDPRFQALVTRLKMIDYWKQYGAPDGCDLQESKLVCR
ncbi:MAG TPA: winged helix-turn-helix domain-containing protein [Steroidobacteraceae bacterium]|nr:winged helix-turn-helix domain-containing protein [Steroidobacteraceae bacterium]